VELSALEVVKVLQRAVGWSLFEVRMLVLLAAVVRLCLAPVPQVVETVVHCVLDQVYQLLGEVA
jgi:Leu/Phe-tRNA-protein transferase